MARKKPDLVKEEIRKKQLELNRLRVKVAVLQLIVSVVGLCMSFSTLMVVLHVWGN